MITCTRADDSRSNGLAGQQSLGRDAGRQSRGGGQQTSRHKQVNKLARHHDGMAGKPVQEGERITTVDGITCYYVCFLVVFCPGEVWCGDSVPRRRSGPGIRSEEGRSGEAAS